MATIVKWGVIGSGGIARRRTIPEGITAAANARLVAVHDLNREVNQEVARTFGARAVESVEALLGEDLDAVYIATPPNVHLAQAEACARAGKHVLCEKPLGLAVTEADQMIATCRAAGVRLGTALMMRFHSQHRAARRLIEEGRLGRPVFARAQLSCWYPPIAGAWRQDPAAGGGGSLMDMGGHCMDLLEMFFGPVAAVSCAVRSTIHTYPVEDSAVVTLHFTNGALGVVDTFFCIPDEGSRNVLELYGSQGSILARGTIGQAERGEMVACLRGGPAGYDAKQARTESSETPIAPAPVNMYRAEIEEFSRAVLEGREPENDARIGRQNQRLLAACYASAEVGHKIEL